jgi:hypothetical protein
VKTVSGDHTASYLTVTGGCFSEVKRPGPESDHSPPSDAEVKKA